MRKAGPLSTDAVSWKMAGTCPRPADGIAESIANGGPVGGSPSRESRLYLAPAESRQTGRRRDGEGYQRDQRLGITD